MALKNLFVWFVFFAVEKFSTASGGQTGAGDVQYWRSQIARQRLGERFRYIGTAFSPRGWRRQSGSDGSEPHSKTSRKFYAAKLFSARLLQLYRIDLIYATHVAAEDEPFQVGRKHSVRFKRVVVLAHVDEFFRMENAGLD